MCSLSCNPSSTCVAARANLRITKVFPHPLTRGSTAYLSRRRGRTPPGSPREPVPSPPGSPCSLPTRVSISWSGILSPSAAPDNRAEPSLPHLTTFRRESFAHFGPVRGNTCRFKSIVDLWKDVHVISLLDAFSSDEQSVHLQKLINAQSGPTDGTIEAQPPFLHHSNDLHKW